MNLWRLFGLMTCMVAFVAFAAVSLPAQDTEKEKADKAAKELKDKEAKDKDLKDKEAKDKEAKDKEKKPDTKPEEPKKTEAKSEVFKGFAKPFFQEITTNTKQVMKVFQQSVTQVQDQTFYLKYEPKEIKDKEAVIEQTVLGVKMKIEIGGNKIDIDTTSGNLPSNPMSDFFKALKDAKLKFTLGVDSDGSIKVTKVEGAEELIKSLGATNQAMRPLLENILNAKALEQMAEPTFAALPPENKKEWEKKSTLTLKGVGNYTTTSKYKLDGNKVTITSSLSYAIPQDSANSGLPFRIKEGSKLESKEGTGSAELKDGRIVSQKMEMKLEGELKIEIGGQDTSVALEQTQTTNTKTSETNFLK